MTDLAILRMADALARHSSARHELVARNVANADTPGYTAKDLTPFTLELREGTRLKATRASHLNAGERHSFDAQDSSANGAASPNGNDVSLPDQMARAAQAMDSHGRAMAIYGKTLDILRAGLGKR
jgi:flagellar basal-body rod protein FlgB